MLHSENNLLLDRLVSVNERLTELALGASAHVGVSYEPYGLALFVREHDADLAGGPSGSAGDIWFEVTYTLDDASHRLVAPPWTVESAIIVFCKDRNGPGAGGSCLHNLLELTDTASSPESTVDLLSQHVTKVAAELTKFPPATFTEQLHASLP